MKQKFKLEGFYLYANAPNGRGDLTGEVELAEDGTFESEILDHASRFPRQFIRGHLKQERDLARLSFLKSPPCLALANLAYRLSKKYDGSFEGKYAGQWAALPVKIAFNRDYNLFIAQIDMSMRSIGDNAEISLSRM